MSASAVMTVRIEPELLAALKKAAREEGRSISAEVVRLVRARVQPTPGKRARRTMGMFPDFDAPDLESLTSGRKAISATLLRSAARRKPK